MFLPKNILPDVFNIERDQLRTIISMTGIFSQFYDIYVKKNNDSLSNINTFSLYQSILKPWRFFIRIDDFDSDSPYYTHGISLKNQGKYIWVFHEGDSDVADFQSFRKYFIDMLPLAQCNYRGKKIGIHGALRILYHAFNHPEQYVREMIADELDRLLDKYDGWGEGKKI